MSFGKTLMALGQTPDLLRFVRCYRFSGGPVPPKCGLRYLGNT